MMSKCSNESISTAMKRCVYLAIYRKKYVLNKYSDDVKRQY